MVIEKGYKQTEIGVIPEDWNSIPFTEAAELKHGFQFREEHFSKQGIKVVKIGNLSYNGSLKFDNVSYVPESRLKDFSNFLLNIEDVLMALTGATLGKCTIVERQDLLFQNYRVGNFKNKNNSIKKFIYYILQSDYIQKSIKSLVNEAAQPNLGKGDFNKFIIPLPSLQEQTAIASALSDMDQLIAQTEKLIEKKKAIKQGVMQELLRPKEGWVTKKFTDVVNYIHGKAHEQFIVESGEFEVVNSKFISTNGLVKKYSNQSFLTAKKGDVLTVLSDLPNGKALAKCFFVEIDNKYAVNQRICIWRSKEANEKFLYYVLNRHPYFLSLDDGVSQTHILNGHIEKFHLTLPENIEEQRKIAETIWEIDQELYLIETKLQKLKLQKQGMMQALLTGKIRLV